MGFKLDISLFFFGSVIPLTSDSSVIDKEGLWFSDRVLRSYSSFQRYRSGTKNPLTLPENHRAGASE
jgi:hypothetical protein